MDTEFLGIGAVADRLGLSRSRLRQLEEAGIIPASSRLVPGDRRVWRTDDIEPMREAIKARPAAARQRGGPVRAA